MTEKDNQDFDDEFENSTKSKSRIKREFNALQDLAKALISSTYIKLDALPADERVVLEIGKARTMRRAALKRQIQFIGGLLQHEDVDVLRQHLNDVEHPHQESVALFHELEVLRDAMVADEDGAFDKVVARFPEADRQHLRQLMRNSHKETLKKAPPKSARAIFRYLRELHEAE